MDVGVNRFRERAVAFGPNRSMVGVMTTPVPPPPSERPVVVVLNAGVIHRVGANRVNVRVSRALASAGYTAFRFDLSGIGDSEARQDILDLDRAVHQDIADALAQLASTRNARSFVLFGLCSGANNAFQFGVQDQRVRAMVLIDPVAFPTMGHRLRFYGLRLIRPRVWWNALRGRNASVRDLARRLLGRSDDKQELENAYPVGPTRDEMRRGLGALVARGVEMLVVYTGGLEWRYNYARQFHDMFPEEAKSPRILVKYFAESDHTFSDESHKAWLVDLVIGWIGVPVGEEGGRREAEALGAARE